MAWNLLRTIVELMKSRLPDVKTPPEQKERPTVLAAVRTGAVYGATVGMLVGFLYLATRVVGEVEGIVVWRNFVLAGAVVGTIISLTWRYWSGPQAESQN
jgi:uncharacterized membrane protein